MSVGIVHKHTAFYTICWLSSVTQLFYKVLSITAVIQHEMEYTMATVSNNKLGECGHKQWCLTLRHHGIFLQRLRKITEKVPSLDLNLMSEMLHASPMSYHTSIWPTSSLMYLFTLMPRELKHAPSISFIKC